MWVIVSSLTPGVPRHPCPIAATKMLLHRNSKYAATPFDDNGALSLHPLWVAAQPLP